MNCHIHLTGVVYFFFRIFHQLYYGRNTKKTIKKFNNIEFLYINEQKFTSLEYNKLHPVVCFYFEDNDGFHNKQIKRAR